MADEKRKGKGRRLRTERSRVVKLELSNDTGEAVRKTAQTLYNLSDADINIVAARDGKSEIDLKLAKDSNKWVATDAIFDDAKKAYDRILAPFLEEPQVYKLESTKERMHRQSLDATEGKNPHLERIEEYLNEPEEELKDETLSTYLDPFSLPFPWERRVEFKQVVYFNPETFERLNKPPQEIWEKKVDHLGRLKQRDDLDGFEYVESSKEKRFRIMVQDEFDQKLQAKMERRRENPTELEQVSFHSENSCSRLEPDFAFSFRTDRGRAFLFNR